MTLIYFGLDNFKTVNDTEGHDTVDEVLKLVSAILKQNIRKIDIVARLGGDEFTVSFPETDLYSSETRTENSRPQLNSAISKPSISQYPP